MATHDIEALLAATSGAWLIGRQAALLPTCWVLEHGLGVSMRVDEAPQQHSHVGDFVLGQLLQSGLQELDKASYTVSIIYLQMSNILE